MTHDNAPKQAVSQPTMCEGDAAKYLGMSIAYMRKARTNGRGPAYIRIGRAVRYRVADLEHFITSHRVETRDS